MSSSENTGFHIFFTNALFPNERKRIIFLPLPISPTYTHFLNFACQGSATHISNKKIFFFLRRTDGGRMCVTVAAAVCCRGEEEEEG